jgi:hypothetical protein
VTEQAQVGEVETHRGGPSSFTKEEYVNHALRSIFSATIFRPGRSMVRPCA